MTSVRMPSGNVHRPLVIWMSRSPALDFRVTLQPLFENPVNIRLAHLAVTGELTVDSWNDRDALAWQGLHPVKCSSQ
jgi:hypothetical protein